MGRWQERDPITTQSQFRQSLKSASGMDFGRLREQCPVSDTAIGKPDMEIDEINYKRWRIEVLRGEPGWKTLVYHSGSPLHGATAPDVSKRRAVIEEANALVDSNQSL